MFSLTVLACIGSFAGGVAASTAVFQAWKWLKAKKVAAATAIDVLKKS